MATAGSSAPPSQPLASQLDVVFDGAWVIVPSVDGSGAIVGVNVYSPACGHPHGAVFSAQLGPIPIANWPAANAFYMLDSHSHSLTIQRGSGSPAGMKIGAIDRTVNHCVTPHRPLGGNWDLMISINAGPDAWVSAGTITPQVPDSAGAMAPCFSGIDSPTGKVSTLQTLSYRGVTAVELCGAPAAVKKLLPAPWSGAGSLIFEGEIPYIPTLQHEREAIAAMAMLAGLDLALERPLPSSLSVKAAAGPLHPMLRTGGNCGHSLIVLS